MKKLKTFPEYSVIGIYNHPGSGFMSVDDFKSAYKRRYKYGIVICHNSTIYKYSMDSDRCLDHNDWFDIGAQVNEVNDSMGTRDTAIKNLAKHGIKVEVFYVTR